MNSETPMNESLDNPEKVDGIDVSIEHRYTPFSLVRFVIKVVVATITVYLGIAFGYAAFLPYDYNRERANFLHTVATSVLQPTMDLVGNGKISHFYDWREIPTNQIAPEIATLKIRSSNSQKEDFSSNRSQLIYDINQSKEAVILEPASYNGSWSIVKCSPRSPGSDEVICLRSNLIHKGKIRYSIDGESQVWGVDSNDQVLVLNSVKYIYSNEDRNLPLI